MGEEVKGTREGSLEAPIRHPLNWQSPEFYDQDSLFKELERVYDICHGCRRCFNLCNAFPTLFDAIDGSESLELDGVPKKVYWEVVDHCYLCDMCFMTKCPYVPPHEWNLDFPHLMLRAKAVKFKQQGASGRDKILSSTDTIGAALSLPVVAQSVNAMNNTSWLRKLLAWFFDIHANAKLPLYQSATARKQFGKWDKRSLNQESEQDSTAQTKGKVVLFTTCYGNYNEPDLCEDLVTIFKHNGIAITIAPNEQCCGMPKLELGDLDAVKRHKDNNLKSLLHYVDKGWDIVAPIPSCVLMFKQELPLLFPGDEAVEKVSKAIFDPFEYLMLRHKAGKFKTDFQNTLGTVAYHVACHLRVQNIGYKTKECLQLVPESKIEIIERCSGHDGTYAVKAEFHQAAMKICKPVVSRVNNITPQHYCSDCPMAGHHIENGLQTGMRPQHPLKLLRYAYGL